MSNILTIWLKMRTRFPDCFNLGSSLSKSTILPELWVRALKYRSSWSLKSVLRELKKNKSVWCDIFRGKTFTPFLRIRIRKKLKHDTLRLDKNNTHKISAIVFKAARDFHFFLGKWTFSNLKQPSMAVSDTVKYRFSN